MLLHINLLIYRAPAAAQQRDAPSDLASSLISQIETSRLEPEIAMATTSKTVVYNKGL